MPVACESEVDSYMNYCSGLATCLKIEASALTASKWRSIPELLWDAVTTSKSRTTNDGHSGLSIGDLACIAVDTVGILAGPSCQGKTGHMMRLCSCRPGLRMHRSCVTNQQQAQYSVLSAQIEPAELSPFSKAHSVSVLRLFAEARCGS